LTGCVVKLAAQFLLSLTEGKPLRTLRDAGEYVAALPKKETALPHWQIAASCLLTAVEEGGGLVMMARIAMVRALNADEPQPAAAQRKNPAKKYKVVG
jgi:hypothetical protein